MSDNRTTIENFYRSFQQLDAAGMNACYADDIVFSDPVFILLKDDEVRAMWNMLCNDAKDFSLQYGNITELDHEYATCDWTATYTFTKTGRRVVNNVKAYMKLANGKIIEHSDAFRLSDWMRQAFGWKGYWFGWMGFMKRAVRNKARQRLEIFMNK